ncbi:ArsA family ATPase [Jatrophihabitans lederbergiae]|uniref:ArsA-related P-loop ATPase n=1 Tax=Jatrophihabitans lederbergiae TaxID=3075547 RepID=A0ABU2JEH1_9ACTN|nr:ArsA-related P-loop ATPase [Jatrophihabitans sp. DSM 44399]MDT0263375.1 ArsA-related P-loop ATPase [Jatrophihabitans sp. DSM 44399]
MSPRHTPPVFDIDALLKDPDLKVVVTCGSGGVGKTTTAAALALRAAEQGRKVVVLTIDPARRLAQSLGLSQLDNTPRKVAGVDGDGALLAMMLDMKRTFDEVVTANTTAEKAEQIFANPFYQSLSASFAGTQEYMAMEKLSQLRGQLIEHGGWDLIVVDTPPSRSALDFLDAPQRLGRFLDGRMIRLLTAPARAGGKAYLKVVTASFSVFSKVLYKILGNELLSNVSSFVASLETMFGGFRERAEQTYELLKAPGTAFVVVASPEPDALREASFFVERLQKEGMPLAGVVLNRVRTAAAGLTAQRAVEAAERLSRLPEQGPATDLTAAALAVHAECAEAAQHDRSMVARFGAAHPDVAQHEVPALPADIHDLAGLRAVGSALAV